MFRLWSPRTVLLMVPGVQALKRPIVIDLVLALALSGAILHKAATSAPLGVGDLLVAGASFAAVLLRRLRPVMALLLVLITAVVGVVGGVSNPGVLAALGTIVFTITVRSGRRAGFFCALGGALALYLAAIWINPSGWWRFETLGLFAWIFMAAAIGDAVRSHKAYIAEVEERARHAEQTREDEARRRVMDERVRIARELHDVVAHHIAVISVQAGAASHVLAKRPEQVGPVLAHIREASDAVLKEIQSVVGVLRNGDEPGTTEPTPGLDQLPDLLTGLDAAGFAVRREQRGDARELPAMVDLAAYRIAQEALTNAHKYGTGTADLMVIYGRDEIVVEIANPIQHPAGSGYGSGSGSGYGLLGMRERAASAGGSVTAEPVGGDRFRVRAVLPAPAPETSAARVLADERPARPACLPGFLKGPAPLTTPTEPTPLTVPMPTVPTPLALLAEDL
jgi:signal transduction histidine kinase